MSHALTTPVSTEDNSRADQDHLGEQIIQLYANINAATYTWLKLIAQFDAEHTAQRQGFMSTAAWLGYYCGVGTTAAREKVRVARALAPLKAIDAAFAAGRLSYSKVRALTRVATPGNEAQLLNIARHATAHQLARVLRDYAQVTAPRSAVPIAPELTWYTDNLSNNERSPGVQRPASGRTGRADEADDPQHRGADGRACGLNRPAAW